MENIIYRFKNTPEIYADSDGRFWRTKDDLPLNKIYHCGRIAIRDKNKIYGLKKLRKNAVKSIKEINEYPF